MSGMKPTDWWRRALPRSWNIAVAVLVAAVAALVFTHAGVLHVYLKYFGAKSPRIAVDYAGLSGGMDEKAALAYFAPLALRRAKGGVVVFNRDPGWDPLQWNAAYWQTQPPAPRP
jgi:hypothetical protein